MYTPCIGCLNGVPFTGKQERRQDKLRSVIGQMEFSYQVNRWTERGIPFKTHLYVPEIHPATQTQFHEREDEGHVFKVRLKCLEVLLD